MARRIRSRREAPGGRGIVRNRRGDSRKDADHPFEVAADVLLDPYGSGGVGGAESPELEERSGRRDCRGEQEAGRQQPARAHTTVAEPRGIGK